MCVCVRVCVYMCLCVFVCVGAHLQAHTLFPMSHTHARLVHAVHLCIHASSLVMDHCLWQAIVQPRHKQLYTLANAARHPLTHPPAQQLGLRLFGFRHAGYAVHCRRRGVH